MKRRAPDSRVKITNGTGRQTDWSVQLNGVEIGQDLQVVNIQLERGQVAKVILHLAPDHVEFDAYARAYLLGRAPAHVPAAGPSEVKG